MPGFRIDVFVDDTCRLDYPGRNNTGNVRTRNESRALHTIETARNHRYSLKIGQDIATYARSIDRPTYKPEHMQIHHGMQVINRPGKIAWEPVTVVLYETLSSDYTIDETAAIVYGWFVHDGYNKQNAILPPANDNRQRTTGAIYNIENNLIDHRNFKDVEIMLENGIGDIVWKYKLKNAWPGTVEADTLDYTNNDIAHIKLTLIYDRALNINTRVDNARI